MEEYKDSKTAGVYDVDCTAAGKALCEQHGVRGYPTLKYGDPSNLEDYKGGRSLQALSDFAKENLKPVCSPANIDLCDADLDEKIKAGKAENEQLETTFKDEVKALQEK